MIRFYLEAQNESLVYLWLIEFIRKRFSKLIRLFDYTWKFQ